MKGDGGCKGLSAEQAGEEKLPLKSEIITANLGLKQEGNARLGKLNKTKQNQKQNKPKKKSLEQ